MRASDVVNQLRMLLPQLTDKFTTDIAAKSISRSGTVMTAVCNDKHKLQPGQAFAIVGTDVPIPIASITKSGNIATLKTTTNHDLTKLVAKTIRITGATEAQFNGTFATVDIINRKTITFTVPDTQIFSYDNQLAKFEGISTTISNESNIVAPVESLGSLKVSALGISTALMVRSFQVGGIGGVVPVDISTLTALSFWVHVDSAVFANLIVTGAFTIRFSSDITLATDWAEYKFDKSVFTADTWVQLFIDIVNTTPDGIFGSVDLTKIVSLVSFYSGIIPHALGDSVYYDDLDKGITIASGSPALRDAESALRSYNTTHKVDSVTDEVTFKFTHSVTGLPDPGGTLLIRTKPRISSGININRIEELYTTQKVDQYWAFVVIQDVDASQSRLIASDALDNQQRNVNYRQQIIESFTVYVIMPVSDEIAASKSRDIASDLLRPFLRSLLFSKFSTGLFADKLNTVQFTGHGVSNYNTAIYVHSYSFQQVAEIYEEDTVGPDLDVAMRDIDFKMFLDFGTQVEFLQGTPDLDDKPL